MKPMYLILLVVNDILSLVTSQTAPINITNWKDVTAVLPQPTCQLIGGYDYTNKVMKLYGGISFSATSQSQAEYTFNPETETFTSVNNESLSVSISVKYESYTQAINGDVIYFIDESTPQTIKGINIQTNVVAVYANLNPDPPSPQTDPTLCIDDATGTLYVVGDGQIETCTPNSALKPTCSVFEPAILEDITRQSCEYYNGNLFIFGGLNGGDNSRSDKIWKCDPNPSVQSCAEDPDSTLFAKRAGIRTVKIECFGNNFIALIGGSVATGDASSMVELYNLKTENLYGITNSDSMQSPRKHFVALFDPENEEIFVFGGAINAPGTSCTDTVSVTKLGREGMCFTSDPTMDPTIDPTFDPTIDPTFDPTVNPTSNPTVGPTKGPTSNPITTQPTGSPITTTSPAPTRNPTTKPTPKTYEPQTEGYTTSGGAYGIIIAILVIICCIILLCFCWYDREEKQHVYGRMDEAGAVAAGGGAAAVGMAVVTYCNNCGKATPCDCKPCNNCGQTSCDGTSCKT